MRRPIFEIFAFGITFLFLFSAFAQQQSIFDLVNLRDRNLADVTAYEKIKIIDAWQLVEQIHPSTTAVIIGVLDTGIEFFHQEFIDVPITTNILVDKQPGGHGTQVIGIIGANNPSFTQSYLPPQMNGLVSGIRGLNYRINVRSLLDIPDMAGVVGDIDRVLRFEGGSVVFNGSFSM